MAKGRSTWLTGEEVEFLREYVTELKVDEAEEDINRSRRDLRYAQRYAAEPIHPLLPDVSAEQQARAANVRVCLKALEHDQMKYDMLRRLQSKLWRPS